MTRLDRFLSATDLDELLQVREEISFLTPEESKRIGSVVRDWNDPQAVANLMFHPDLIPTDMRFEALDRALHSKEVPYFTLAAAVGLQGVALDEVPDEKRTAWVQTLLALVQSKSTVLAGRASVTLCRWSRSSVTADVLPPFVSIYPVSDENACRNIVAAVLDSCGELSADEFDRRLSDWRVSGPTRASLRQAHVEYTEKKGRDALQAMIMKAPLYCYIPNLSEGVIGDTGCADVETVRPAARRAWWQLW